MAQFRLKDRSFSKRLKKKRTTRAKSTRRARNFSNTLQDNSEWLEIIEDLVTEYGDELESDKELYSMQVSEIESDSRDGFIPFTNGGFEATGFVDLSHFNSTGKGVGGNGKAENAIEGQIETAYEMALDEFKDQYETEIEGMGYSEDQLNYHDLYDLDRGDLAEALSEIEHEYLSDEDSSVMYQIGVYYYDPSNSKNDFKGEHSIYVYGVINWEAPYHRRQDKFEEVMKSSGSFSFKDSKDLEIKLKKKLKDVYKEIG